MQDNYTHVICPLCGEKMNRTSCETFSQINPTIISEEQQCKCGTVYQYMEGAERFGKNGKEIKVN